MFVAKNQIFVFIACVAIGGIGGVFFTLSACIKVFFKNGALRIIPDIVAFIAFSVFYALVSYNLGFPSFRLYMAAGVFIGLVAYMKSFNNILAIWAKKLYNITVKKIVARKKKSKASSKENVGNIERRKRFKIRGHGKRREPRGRTV